VEQDEPDQLFGQECHHRRSAKTCQESVSSLKSKHITETIFVDDALPSAVLFDNAMASAAVNKRFLEI
jgi:hypothetical protein